jgi:hypothetical protein
MKTNQTIKLKFSAVSCLMAFTLGSFAGSALAGDKDSALKGELTALEAKRDALEDVKDPTEKTEAEIDQLDKKIDILQEEVEMAEDAREEAAEDKEDLFKGNANQTRDWIKAESDAVQKRLSKTVKELEEAEEECLAKVKAADNENGSFTKEQMLAHLDQFDDEAVLVLGTLDNDLQNMLYTYKAGKNMVATKPDSTPEAAVKDTSVTGKEEEKYDNTQDVALKMIEEKADAIQKRIGETSDKIENLEGDHVEAVFASLKKNSKFPYSWKRSYLNKFKGDAATALVILRDDVGSMFPRAKTSRQLSKK